MPLTIKELLLCTPVRMNVSEEELSRTYLAIESLFGEALCDVSAVAFRWVLMTVATDAKFQSGAGSRCVALLASIAYVLSDAMMCCMEKDGQDSQPLYREIQSGMTQIDSQLKKGMKAWKLYYNRRLQRDGIRLTVLESQIRTARRREPLKEKPGTIVLTVRGDGPESQSRHVRLCGNCPPCLAVMERVKGRTSITQDELTMFVDSVRLHAEGPAKRQ